MMNETWISPAKLNLYLAITGIRDSDGFHELDSSVALLDFGDSLQVGVSETGQDVFECSDPRLKWDERNLIQRAAMLFRSRTGHNTALKIRLQKRIPMGAGLGGGSSNASTLLKALNKMHSNAVDRETLLQWSAELGSDCPLFFREGLVRMQGRGEEVTTLSGRLIEFLKEKRVIVFHPGFGVSAAWAYQRLKTGYPMGYSTSEGADMELRCMQEDPQNWQQFWRNDLQPVVEQKYLAIPLIIRELKERWGVFAAMSGSGSACFCVLDANADLKGIRDTIHECWGDACFLEDANFLF